MPFPTRVTGAFLRVLEIFVRAFDGEDLELHGWAIKKSAGLSGAATYKMLDRLEGAGWIAGRWETRNPEPGKPPRRLYQLTATGAPAARALLAERGHRTVRDPDRLAAPGRGAAPGRISGIFSTLASPRVRGTE